MIVTDSTQYTIRMYFKKVVTDAATIISTDKITATALAETIFSANNGM